MKKILIQMHSPIFANNGVFDNPDPDHCMDSWRMLKQKLFEIGYELTTADNNDLTDCECIIFIDNASLGEPVGIREKLKNVAKIILRMKIYQTDPIRKLYSEAFKANMLDKMIFIIWEGKAICPSNFYQSTWNKFKYILTWDDNLVDNKKFFKFFLPISNHNLPIQTLSFNEKKFLVNISINKHSSYKNELYSFRRKSIAYFTLHYPNDFDLFGTRWHQPITRWQKYFSFLVKHYGTYRGLTKDKLDTLSKYKFNLCYENTSDAKGYVTEKIFEALRAGTVPIYWGADNIDKYVDAEAFIDRRRFKNDEELAKYLMQVTEKEYENYLLAGKRYLGSKKYIKSLPSSFCDRMIEILKENKIIT